MSKEKTYEEKLAQCRKEAARELALGVLLNVLAFISMAVSIAAAVNDFSAGFTTFLVTSIGLAIFSTTFIKDGVISYLRYLELLAHQPTSSSLEQKKA